MHHTYVRSLVLLACCGSLAAGPAGAASFDVFLRIEPPPNSLAVFDPTGPGGETVPVQIISLSLVAAAPPGEPELTPGLLELGTSAPVGTTSSDAFFDVFLDAAEPVFASRSYWGTSLDVTLPGSGERGKGIVRGVGTPPTGIAGFFDVFYEVTLPDPAAPRLLHLHGQISQPGLGFGAVRVAQASPDSFFDIFVEVVPEPGAAIATDRPVYRVTLTSAALPEPGVLLLIASAAAALGAARSWRIR